MKARAARPFRVRRADVAFERVRDPAMGPLPHAFRPLRYQLVAAVAAKRMIELHALPLQLRNSSRLGRHSNL